MLQILILLPVIIGSFAVLLQLRLSALGLAPVKFDLPDLPTLEPDNRLGNIPIEKIGENDLLYPECMVVSTDKKRGTCAFLSLGDGRIVRITGGNGWNDVVHQTVVRTGALNDNRCGMGGPADANNMEPSCGRPLGLWLSKRSTVDPDFTVSSRGNGTAPMEDESVLLVADAYMGFQMVTKPYGSYPTPKVHTLATRAKSDPPDHKFSLLNGVVQTSNGDVYLTETSQKHQRRRIFHAAMDGTPTGRLLRYRRKEGMEVVAENIYMANGMAISHDGASLLIVSGVSIVRYDLVTQQMDPVPFVEVMPGTGDNIKAMDQLPNGKRVKCYWAALGGKYTQPFSLLKFVTDKPWLRSFLLAVVPYRKLMDLIPKWAALAVYDEQGNLMETLRDDGNTLDENGKKVKLVAPWLSEMEPIGNHLYLLSWYNPFLARIKRKDIDKYWMRNL